MELFFKLEAGYLIIALFILLITAFVSTRDFMPKGSFKKGILIVLLVVASAIGLHFKITTDRIDKVKEAFYSGKNILCENRVIRVGTQYVNINKNREWSLNGYIFSSPNFERDFFIARCIVE
jgi:hypothetical protein